MNRQYDPSVVDVDARDKLRIWRRGKLAHTCRAGEAGLAHDRCAELLKEMESVASHLEMHADLDDGDEAQAHGAAAKSVRAAIAKATGASS